MDYLILDIETLSPNDKELDIEQSLLKPSAAIKDPKKIAANLVTKNITMRKKAALTDSASICIVGIKCDKGIFSFNSLPLEENEIKTLSEIGICCVTSKDEKGLLLNLSLFLENQYQPETEIVTFNGVNFDLPKSRFRYATHNLFLPKAFDSKVRIIDLMLRYSKYYSMSKVPFVSMGEVAARLGILKGDKIMSGAVFGQLIEDGKYLEAVIYNALDCVITEKIYYRLCR